MSKNIYTCQYCGKIYKRSDTHRHHEMDCKNNPANSGVKIDNDLAKILKGARGNEPAVPNIPQSDRMTTTKTINADLGNKIYNLHLGATGIIQYKFNNIVKDLDVRTQNKKEKYIEIYDAILEKYGINLNLPPELALLSEVSQDIAASVIAREMMPTENNKEEKTKTNDIMSNIDWN